jgi:hypothetical protein
LAPTEGLGVVTDRPLLASRALSARS